MDHSIVSVGKIAGGVGTLSLVMVLWQSKFLTSTAGKVGGVCLAIAGGVLTLTGATEMVYGGN